MKSSKYLLKSFILGIDSIRKLTYSEINIYIIYIKKGENIV